eukprot:2919044-Prorocentrum_lima.AAC.1
MMVEAVSPERLDEILAQRPEEARPKDAILDGGAQSFVVGGNTLATYVEHLRAQGAREPILVEILRAKVHPK